MEIDYEEVLPIILEAMFPHYEMRMDAKKTLDEYGRDSWHPMPSQIKVAILRLFYNGAKHPAQLEKLVSIACSDYRDILYFAEQPLSFEDWTLPDANPQKYAELLQKDKENYLKWINAMIEKSR